MAKASNRNQNMMGFITANEVSYAPISGFTSVELGCKRGNNAYTMIQKMESPFSDAYTKLFDDLWNDKSRLQEVTEEVIESITTAYNENSPEFIYFVTLYNIFNEFLEDISEDFLPNEAVGYKESKIWNLLYNFRKDAANSIINKLEKYNSCILADSVGLGTTFTALAVIKYYENRNKNVLVICPKKLTNNWNTYKDDSPFREKLTYYPDIIALTKDNHIAVIEVKPTTSMSYHKNIEKYEALGNYCKEHGYIYAMIDPDDNFMTFEELKNIEICTCIEYMFYLYREDIKKDSDLLIHLTDKQIDDWYVISDEDCAKTAFRKQVHSMIISHEWYNIYKHGFNVYNRPVKLDNSHKVIDYI